jgi:Tfp pilus assembly protein PilF
MFLRNLFRFIPRSPLRRALDQFNSGEFETAARLLDELLGRGEASGEDLGAYAAEAYLEAGKRCLAAGDVTTATGFLERAAALCPQYADVQLQLGQVYERADRPDAARMAYESALQVNPRFFEARLSLARLFMRLGSPGAAARQLDEACRSGPKSAAHAVQELRERIETSPGEQAASGERLDGMFERLLSGPPSLLPAGLETARRALRAGDNKGAIRAVKTLLKQHPEYPDLHNLLGVAYDNEEMSDDAIEEFESSLKINSQYTDARVNLGLTLFNRGHFEEAERHLRLAEQQRPGLALVRTVLAQIETRGSSSSR